MAGSSTAFTLQEQVAITDRKYMGKGEVTMVIRPGDDGLNLTTLMGRFPINSDYVNSYRRLWGRMLVVTNRPVDKARLRDVVALVPEHVLAPLHVLNITDAEIEISDLVLRPGEHLPYDLPLTWGIPWNWGAASFPVCGGTSEQFYKALVNNRRPLNGKKTPVYRVVKSFSFPEGCPRIYVSSADCFKVEVVGMPNDRFGYSPKNVSMEDVYGQVAEHMSARPLVTPPLLKKIPRYGDWFVGYNDRPALNPTEKMPQDQKVARMQPRYREGRNEQLYHTIIDMLGELGALVDGPIEGCFRFFDLGGGHVTRFACFKRMLADGVMKRYES